MMKRTYYKVIEQIIFSEEFGEYCTFGLQVEEISDNIHRETYILHDIKTDENFVSEAAQLFNAEQLEAIHFEEVVQDII